MDYTKASNEELEILVNNKDGKAICELGNRCMYGKNGHKVDLTRAYQLFHKGEKMQLKDAYIGLGEMYRCGLRFAKNEKLAREYYRKAGMAFPNEGVVSFSNEEETVFPNEGVTDNELKGKLYNAERARLNEEYESAKMQCNNLIRLIQDIKSKAINYIGNKDIDYYNIEANWILAYTAFNEQKYMEMENYLAVDGVMGLHPWGAYLTTVGHKIMNAPKILFKQDLQLLLTIINNQNLTNEEKGDTNAMIADLISEGYGETIKIMPNMAKKYYENAIRLGCQYAREQINKINVDER